MGQTSRSTALPTRAQRWRRRRAIFFWSRDRVPRRAPAMPPSALQNRRRRMVLVTCSDISGSPQYRLCCSGQRCHALRRIVNTCSGFSSAWSSRRSSSRCGCRAGWAVRKGWDGSAGGGSRSIGGIVSRERTDDSLRSGVGVHGARDVGDAAVTRVCAG